MATVFAASTAAASTSGVVISQIYGGGGNTGSTYKSDFIELFNAGTSSVDLSTWSVQYNSSTGINAWQKTNLSGSIAPGQYFLIKEADGAGGTVDLPTPDVTGTIAMGAGGGRVILASTQTAYAAQNPSGCPADMSAVVDLLGVSGASCVEGTGAPAPSATTALLRADSGCTDTNDNAADFAAGTVNPRNTATAAHSCGGGTNPTNPSATGSANPASVAQGGATTLTVLVTPGTLPASVSYTVTVDLSSIGGGSTVAMANGGSDGNGHVAFTAPATVTAATAPGSKSLPVLVTDDQNRTGSTSIALTVTAPPVTIMAIQGHGAASPMVGQTIVTNGNVVTAVGPKGFFMQDPNGDGDATTSDGIYVFTSSAPTVTPGNIVNVSGKVAEYSGSTELTNVAIAVVAVSGATVAPFELAPTTDPTTGPCVGGNSTLGNPPTASEGYQASNFACLDGMLVTMSDATVTGATFGGKINSSDPVGADAVHTGLPNGFYAQPSSLPRPFHGPGALYPGIAGHPAIPVWNGEPQVIEIYYKGLGFAPGSDDPDSDNPGYADPSDFVYHAGTRFSVVGVIQGYQATGAASPIYEIYPREMTTLARVTPADAVRAIPDPAAGMLTIGTQNLLHMFNDVLDGGADTSNCPSAPALGGSDWCPTTPEYAVRRTKWARQVCDVLKSPVVLDVEEIESLAVAHDLADSIQARCGTQYDAYVIPGNDVGGINIGILVRNDVAVESVTQIYKDTTTANCSSGTSCLLNDRPPVLMKASWNGYDFALLAIYGRSLSGIDTKPYVGPKRAEQAAQVAQIAQAWQSGSTLAGAGNAQQAADGTITQGPFDIVGDATVPLIVAGDFNAYQFSDGYADVTGMIMGTADQTRNLYWANGYVAPSPALVDSGVAADPASRYSFNFDGLAQEIDHILLSRRAWQDFVRVDNAHGNSDVAEASGVILDDLTAARSGDHDGQVVTLVIDRIFADGFDGAQ